MFAVPGGRGRQYHIRRINVGGIERDITAGFLYGPLF
jgi:hypothetical protein